MSFHENTNAPGGKLSYFNPLLLFQLYFDNNSLIFNAF